MMCDYHGCEKHPDGTLSFFFGERSYCSYHYAMMVQDFDGDIEVVDGVTDE